MTFRLARHSSRNVDVVELWEGGRLVGQITPGAAEAPFTLRVLSKSSIAAVAEDPERATPVHVITVTIGSGS